MGSHSLDILARLDPAVPAAVAERASARSDRPVAPAAAAASVVLVRDSDRGVEAYLLHRHARMSFAASMVVFPGGGVDPVDRVAETLAVQWRNCALRETAEETGVVLSAADLHDWAHWTTPEMEPRRYDTWFYLAVMPKDQQARDISGETDRAGWLLAADALAAADRGELALMPPTRSILMELADISTTEELLSLAANRTVVEVMPKLIKVGKEWAFEYPVAEPGRTSEPASPGEPR